LIADDRFLTNSLRLANRDELNEKLEKAFSERNFLNIEKEFLATGVTMARINNLQEVFQKQEAQDLILEEKLENGKVVKSVKTAVFKIK